jgi:hypothetical protein
LERAPSAVARCRIRWRGSMAMMNMKGERGSPCRSPQ